MDIEKSEPEYLEERFEELFQKKHAEGLTREEGEEYYRIVEIIYENAQVKRNQDE